MSRAFPYRRPPLDVITTAPWTYVAGDAIIELPSDLPHWDYGTVLHLRRDIRVDGRRARELSGLADDAELAISVRWAASSSLLRGRAWRAPVTAEDGIELTIEFDLAGDELGGNLQLETLLTLRRRGSGRSVTAAHRAGSVLWSDRTAVLLQGDAVLFPVAHADFHLLPYPEKASWYLEIGEDLDAAAMGSLLLIANERRPSVMRAITAASAATPEDHAVLSVLRADMLRSLVEAALGHDDFDDRARYPSGSLGAVLSALLRHSLPGMTIEALRRERATEPAYFSSRIQDAADMLAGR